MEENTPKKDHLSNSPEADVQMDEHMDSHNYDGIQELDNPPPRWIMAIFYITIAFSIIYAAFYFWLDVGDHQDTKYVKKSELHESKYKMESESSGEMGFLADAADLEEGKTIYREMNCGTCHGLNLEGNAIGPNLADNAAVHGCDFQSIFDVIKNGVPAKGMTPFKAQLSDKRIQKVTSYIISLQGSEPENAKEPQGEACE